MKHITTKHRKSYETKAKNRNLDKKNNETCKPTSKIVEVMTQDQFILISHAKSIFNPPPPPPPRLCEESISTRGVAKKKISVGFPNNPKILVLCRND